MAKFQLWEEEGDAIPVFARDKFGWLHGGNRGKTGDGSPCERIGDTEQQEGLRLVAWRWVKEAMMNLLGILLLLASASGAQQPAHRPSDAIDEDDLRAYIAREYDCEPDKIDFVRVEPFDFLGKGYDQVLVLASTGLEGSSGPGVNSVFTRDEQGELKEIAKEEVKLEHRVLFGKVFSVLRIENGLLVEEFGDSSGREDPLVIKYKWDAAKEQFVAVDIKAAKPYPTSYDCAKAEKGQNKTEQAICYVKSLAELDVELGEAYKAYLAGLAADSRKSAIAEQRGWIRERDQECPIYKWWVDCLEEKYNTRIDELEKKTDEQKRRIPSR